MPTGYTACVLEGADFTTFAKKCILAFGAAVHQRDDGLDVPYQPRKPSDYHTKALEEAKAKLVELEALTSEQRIAQALLAYKKEQASLLDGLKKRQDDRAKLEAMMEQANTFIPPTPDHENFKKFMVEQLELTMRHEGDTSYYEEKLNGLKEPVSEADGNAWFEAQRKGVQWNIDYHTKEGREEVERCENANAWVQQAVEAIAATAQGEQVSTSA